MDPLDLDVTDYERIDPHQAMAEFEIAIHEGLADVYCGYDMTTGNTVYMVIVTRPNDRF